MSTKMYGFYFSTNADGSANDYTIYVELQRDGGLVKLSPRYKSSQPNPLYEIIMDEKDLRLFAEMCLGLANVMENDHD